MQFFFSHADVQYPPKKNHCDSFRLTSLKFNHFKDAKYKIIYDKEAYNPQNSKIPKNLD